MPPRLLIGSDTGGTFTDFVRLDETGLRTWKIASTPDDFARAVLDGVGRLLAESPSRPSAVELVHSTTVATNALLERKGARVALLTTRGFRDVLAIGRQSRAELYDLHVATPPPLVPVERRLEIVLAKSGLERQRLLRWIIAWCGLSASWFMEDEDPLAKINLTILAKAAAALGA